MSLEKFLSLERKYNLNTLTYQDQKIWTFLRGYVADKYLGKKEDFNPTTNFSFRLIKPLLNSLLFSLPALFRKYEYWCFSDTNRRVNYEESYFDFLVDPISSIVKNSLIIERPNPSHYPRKKTFSKSIISKFILFSIEATYKFFHKTSKIDIRNEEHLINFLREINISINYREIILKHVLQEKSINALMQLFGKPKLVFFVVAYNNMGYIKALNTAGVKVIEIQHGLISKNHVWYRVEQQLDDIYYPKYFFSFSSSQLMEHIYSSSMYFKKMIKIPVGNYLIQKNIDIQKNEFLESKGSRLLATTQDFYGESIFINLLIELANRNPTLSITFKPRNKSKNYYTSNYKFPSNFTIDFKSNLYDLFKEHDIHCTVYSTCALEAGRSGLPNILFNIDELYQHIIQIVGKRKYFGVVDNIFDFENLITKYSFINKFNVYQENTDIYVEDYNSRLGNAIEHILGENDS